LKHHPNEKTQQHRGHKILLVDDEEDIIRVLRRGLELQGFDVDAYTSPKEAVTFFKPDMYHLAILDIRMPGMNGFMLYRKLKEQDPDLGACFLSAFEIHQDEFKKVFPSMADSVKKIIKKPVTINNLIKEITPILKTSVF
jgi:CheY-like chemotaxis protein